MMDLVTVYSTIHGDLPETLSRLGSEKLLLRLLEKFRSDRNLELLEKALEEGDPASAFLAVHTLKGVALNLGFTELAKASSDLTELLRPYGQPGSTREISKLPKTEKEEMEVLARSLRKKYMEIKDALQE